MPTVGIDTRWFFGTGLTFTGLLVAAIWALAMRINASETNSLEALQKVTALVAKNAAAIEGTQATLATLSANVSNHIAEPYHLEVLELIDDEVAKAVEPLQRSLDRIERKLDTMSAKK